MKDRLLTGWNFQRIMFLLAGGSMMIVSVMDHQWIGSLIGGYFAAMGLFAFGCAGGHCAGGACDHEPDTDTIQKMK